MIGVREVKRRPRMTRLVFEGEIVCPAGAMVSESTGGTACRCRITGETITARHDPSTLALFCMASYTTCPTWRTEKETFWEERKGALEAAGEA